jgi:hypothetical protein
MKSIIKSLLISAIAVVFFSASCNKTPYIPNFEHAGGFVIGKETCKTNPDDDYWLVDLSYPLNTVTTYGDTITIGGTFYTNMIKTTQLPATFKIIGKKVSFDFHLSSSKVETTGCTVATPIIYKLKEMQVIASGEIR